MKQINLQPEDTLYILGDVISDPDLLADRLDNFTANDFFRCCALGYNANKYEGTEKTPREQYFYHADGRDGGLGDIDPDDPKAFAEWLHCREHHGAHPWEVCRGGNSTHVDLRVLDDDKGYFLYVAGTSTWRSVEAIKFFLAIREAGLPVVIHHAELLKDRLRGMEKVGVVPFGCMVNSAIRNELNHPSENVEAVQRFITNHIESFDHRTVAVAIEDIEYANRSQLRSFENKESWMGIRNLLLARLLEMERTKEERSNA